MTTESLTSSNQKKAQKKASVNLSSTPSKGQKPSISPAKRWLLISENVYARAQKRGFVGGDPLEDLVAAEREIDAAYDTDFEGLFTLTDTNEIAEQFKSLFAGHGFDHHNLDSLMDGHQEALERLASFNRELIDSTSGLAVKQTDLLQDVASEAAKTLQSFTQGWIRPEGVFKPAELSMQAIDNALSHFQNLATSMAGITQDKPKAASDQKRLQGAFVKAYDGKSLKELTEAPTSALKGISKSLAKQLEAEFSVKTIRDMATNKYAEWASGIVLLADADQGEDLTSDAPNLPAGSRAIADSAIAEVHDISESQEKLLREAFRIETARDLANNRFFSVARAIVMLADVEG